MMTKSTDSAESNNENSVSEAKTQDEVVMDRRWQKRRTDENENAEAPSEGNELEDSAEEVAEGEAGEEAPTRRKKQRRRQIDPTTCERDYNGEEIVFMRALDDYKRNSGRMFPTCSEILEVIRALGYVQLTDEETQILESIQQVEDDIAEGLETSEEHLAPAQADEESLIPE